MAIEHAERARALVGTRFRLQGRGCEGLDCVGLVVAAFGIGAGCVRRDYRLRTHDRRELQKGLDVFFRRIPSRTLRAGDVLLMAVDPQRIHLGVRTDVGFVHAHAGIGRVVETPGMPPWPILGAYRRRTRARRG